MNIIKENLGKVAVTVEKEPWNSNKNYDKLVIVQESSVSFRTYISRKPVPASIPLTNRDYWIPFSGDSSSSVGYSDELYDRVLEKFQEAINDDFNQRLLALEVGKVSINGSLTINGSSKVKYEGTGEQTTFSMSVTLSVPTGSSEYSWTITRNINGTDVVIDSSQNNLTKTVTETISGLDYTVGNYTYKLNAYCYYKGTRLNLPQKTITFRIVLPSYVGFSIQALASSINYSENSGNLDARQELAWYLINNRESVTIQNPSQSSEYLWIIVPSTYTIGSIKIEAGSFTEQNTLDFVTPPDEIGGYKFYRSLNKIDNTNSSTYYIN